MLRKRLTTYVSESRRVIYRNYCSTKHPDDTNESNVEETKSNDLKSSDPKDRIMSILNIMIEENTQRGGQKFESKFPNENIGFKKSNFSTDNFKSDDSEEMRLKKAVSAVANSMMDEKYQVENDLLTKAMEIHKPSDVNWSDLISGMQVENEKEKAEIQHTRADEVKKLLKHSKQRQVNVTPRAQSSMKRSQEMERVNLQDPTCLNIFDDIEKHNSGTELKMWNNLKENELNIAITHPPTNYFQKMILWTKQGKIWKFPIDNEQGMESEQSVHFSEHVFLETHLEGWCPTKGPVRHFMELVCVGLSKNPYYTVQEKIDHIMWYKEYLGNKVDLLQQTNSLQDGFKEKVQQLDKQA